MKRAANIPCRYLFGTIEIHIDKGMNWVCVETPQMCIRTLCNAGILVSAVIKGGKITAIREEHIWVEVYWHYGSMLGIYALPGKTKKAWLSLAPAFKQYFYLPKEKKKKI